MLSYQFARHKRAWTPQPVFGVRGLGAEEVVILEVRIGVTTFKNAFELNSI